MHRSSGVLAAFVTFALVARPVLGASLSIPPVNYPHIIQFARLQEGFAPVGWRTEAKILGDLNGDGLADVALVLREANTVNVIDATRNFGPKRFDTNPRILIVALAEATGGYKLVIENHTLIPRATQPSADDYFDTADIKRGVFHLHLRLFMSSGGWDASNVMFAFRYQNERLELIGYDSSDVARNSGESRDVSVNYLTSRQKVATGNVSADQPDKITWTSLPKRPLLTIQQIGDGLMFNPESK